MSDEPRFDGLGHESESEPERTGPNMGPTWDTDEALENLKMERSVNADLNNAQLTARLLAEAAPTAAMSIIHLAMHSSNDNTRLNAAKYITDRMIEGSTTVGEDGWESLVGEVVSNAELFANGK